MRASTRSNGSARCLSKANKEGDLRENMANADSSASVHEISVSPGRYSGRRAKPLCIKRKSASAARCLRSLGATIAMTNLIIKTSQGFYEGRIVAWMFTKSQQGYRVGYWG